MAKFLIPESFPNLPSALQKLQKMFALGDVDNKQLVKLLENDPLLSANILKIVNSPHYGLSKKVSSLNQAVTLLGTTIIRGIVMAAVLKKSFTLNLSPYGMSIDTFDMICSLRVKFLKEWIHDNTLDMQNLLSAAFLMEAGKIITSNLLLQHNYYDKFVKLLEDFSITEAENTILGLDSYKVAGILFQKWEFEESFTELMMGISTPVNLEQKILHVISVLISLKGILSDHTIKEALDLATDYKLDTVKLEASIKAIQKEFE